MILGTGEDMDGIILHIVWLDFPNDIDLTQVSLQTIYGKMTNTVTNFLKTKCRRSYSSYTPN